MRFRQPSFSGALATAALALAFAACNGDSTGQQGALTPDRMRSFLQQNFGTTAVFFNAFAGLQAAIGGTPVEGITVNPVGNEVQATVGLDLDENGSRETTISANAVFSSTEYSFASGATIQITSIASPFMSGSASATAVAIGTGALLFENVTGNFSGSKGGQVDVVAGGFTVEFIGNFVSGFVDIEAGSGSSSVSATIFFEDNGQGGWRMRVVGDDFEFTVP